MEKYIIYTIENNLHVFEFKNDLDGHYIKTWQNKLGFDLRMIELNGKYDMFINSRNAKWHNEYVNDKIVRRSIFDENALDHTNKMIKLVDDIWETWV